MVYKEGGWGWIVVIATGYSFGIIIGLINNYALIYNEFDRVYNQTENHVFYAGMACEKIEHLAFKQGVSLEKRVKLIIRTNIQNSIKFENKSYLDILFLLLNNVFSIFEC